MVTLPGGVMVCFPSVGGAVREKRREEVVEKGKKGKKRPGNKDIKKKTQ